MSTKRKRKIFNVTSEVVTHDIASQLDRLCSFLHDSYDVNYGGCCYVAYWIYKLLKDDGFNPTLAIVDDEVEPNIFEDTSFNHYYIILDGYGINKGGGSYEYTETYCGDPSEILDHYEKCDWNSMYDSSRNYFISRVIKSFYYDYTKPYRE